MKLVGRLDPYKPGIHLYRLDQLPFGGGNKVPRFIEFFTRHHQIQTLVAMSDMGAHTFNALMAFYNSQSPYCIDQMIFLENAIGMTDYQKNIREKYQNHPDIKVHSGPTWRMFICYTFYKYFTSKTVLGIGGHVKLSGLYFAQLFEDCLRQLPKEKVLHILPVSSGDMLLAFLKVADEKEQRFIGVMTGNPLSRLLLKYKFRHYENVKLLKPKAIGEVQYGEFGQKFYQQTGISLDPVHAIQCVYLANHLHRPLKQQVVIWMTQPDTQYFNNTKD